MKLIFGKTGVYCIPFQFRFVLYLDNFYWMLIFIVVNLRSFVMSRVAQHDFSKSPQALIPRTKFNRTHTHKLTFDAGKLVPFYVDEVLPGDTFSCHATF